MKKLYGVTVAMITPFTEKDEVDYASMGDITEMLIQKGVSCLYPCGTTGEMLRLSVDERKGIAETVVKKADKRIPVFIHVGSMRMDDTIELARHACAIGADGIGVVTPQFFTANDKELENYFITVAKSVPKDFPVYLYNIPQCAANNLTPEVAKKVSQQCSNVVGIKYSFADSNTTLSYLQVKEDFSVLHGYDKMFHGMLTAGCDGTVSGCACIFPEPFVEVYKAWQKGDMQEAAKWQKIASKFSDALKCGSNMAIFKSALTMRGIDAGHMRLPQLDLNDKENSELEQSVRKLCQQYNISFNLN